MLLQFAPNQQVEFLIGTAKLNNVDPQAWLADVLTRIAEQPVTRLDDLLAWNWRKSNTALAA